MEIPVGFAQVTHHFIGGAVPRGAVTTYGIEWAPPLDPQAAAFDIHASFGAEVLTVLSNSVTLDRTVVKAGPTDLGPTFETGPPNEGNDGLEPEPPQVAYLIKKRTALGGRANRGRMYLPGVTTANVDETGAVTPSKFAALQLAMETHLAFLDTNNVSMVILHDSLAAPTPVTQLLTDGRVATQRRRLR